jgi:hypothetical protein
VFVHRGCFDWHTFMACAISIVRCTFKVRRERSARPSNPWEMTPQGSAPKGYPVARGGFYQEPPNPLFGSESQWIHIHISILARNFDHMNVGGLGKCPLTPRSYR